MTAQPQGLLDFMVALNPPVAILAGRDGQLAYRAYKEDRASRFGNNPYLRLQNRGGVVTESL